MELKQALGIVIAYLEERERTHGERHPSLPSMRAYLLEEEENSALESKTKAELIKLIKQRKQLEKPGPEATQLTGLPIHDEVKKKVEGK